MYDPIFKVRKDATGQMQILLSTEIPGLDIHYSWDNSFPDQFYPTYSGPMYVPKEAVMLKVITYRGQHPVGRMIDMPVSELQQRLK
jgi:hexosaminidase